MTSKQYEEALSRLNRIIDKARVHFYKPIHIAEILYHHRVYKDIDLRQIETYRTESKKWRNIISQQLVGRSSNSSARYEDDLLLRELPSEYLYILGEMNQDASVENYIYRCFRQRQTNLMNGLDYSISKTYSNFYLTEFLDYFRKDPGLIRSVDKVYEIVVYALFSALVELLDVTVTISINQSDTSILNEFSDFTNLVMKLNNQTNKLTMIARLNRVGVTNAADRGLDMWANFGLAIQIKHLSLTEDLAEGIVDSITADRIVIVCKDVEKNIILSLLNQIGWKSRIQSIITESDLITWYEKAMRGQFSSLVGNKVLQVLNEEIQREFPSADHVGLKKICEQRGYSL